MPFFDPFLDECREPTAWIPSREVPLRISLQSSVEGPLGLRSRLTDYPVEGTCTEAYRQSDYRYHAVVLRLNATIAAFDILLAE